MSVVVLCVCIWLWPVSLYLLVPMAAAYVDLQVITACVLEGQCMAVASLTVPVSGYGLSLCKSVTIAASFAMYLRVVVTPLSACP